MKEIGKKVAKLIDVKSIVTIALTIVFCVLAVCGAVGQEFLAIYTMVIGFYFGTQAKKQETVEVLPQPAACPMLGDPEGMAEQETIHPPDVVVEGFAPGQE